jgi:hypothetical protein
MTQYRPVIQCSTIYICWPITILETIEPSGAESLLGGAVVSVWGLSMHGGPKLNTSSGLREFSRFMNHFYKHNRIYDSNFGPPCIDNVMDTLPSDDSVLHYLYLLTNHNPGNLREFSRFMNHFYKHNRIYDSI